MSATSFSQEELLVIESALAIVQRQAVVTETRIHVGPTSATMTFEVLDMRAMGGTLSREEGLEQLMEWCGRELAKLRAAPQAPQLMSPG